MAFEGTFVEECISESGLYLFLFTSVSDDGLSVQ